jgi:K+-sensing histidine kinase KdpD
MNEIEALRQELKQTKLAYLMATQISEFKSGFLARTAHELRSPLSSLIGLHQIVLSDLCENPQEEKEFLTQSYQAAQQFLKLLDELIAISKMDSGAIALEIEPVRLTQVFLELHQLIYLQAQNRRLDLNIASLPSEIVVMADSQRLLQILANIVDVIISHLKEGSIEVSAVVDRASETIRGCIDIDHPGNIWGEPIDLLQSAPEVQSTLKQALQETDSFTRKIQMSPGMKLWTAQTLLEMMDGHLTVLEVPSQEGSETITRLRCWLPLAPPK